MASYDVDLMQGNNAFSTGEGWLKTWTIREEAGIFLYIRMYD